VDGRKSVLALFKSFTEYNGLLVPAAKGESMERKARRAMGCEECMDKPPSAL
jgi:hypothetical protein